MSYADIKTKTVEEIISEEQFYTLKESLVQSYLFMDEFKYKRNKKGIF